MTLDSSNPSGLYAAIAIYFIMITCAVFIAYRRLQTARQQAKALGKKEDVIESHYLGNRSFGPLLTTGSLFASLFSGYTVVGIPNEAHSKGWIALRWPAATTSLAFGFMVTAARLHKIGLLRNHQSPVDFVTDRFRSQVLRYTAVVLMTFTGLVYLTAQLVAIKSTFNSLFNINTDSTIAVLVISALILIFEWVGGLSSVALTDCIQGFIMVICFVALPIVIAQNYGGWGELDWETYPRQDFYQTPTGNEQWLFWNFTALLFGGFLQPHLMQRVYAAENFKSLKIAYSTIAVGPWFTMISGIFLGTIGVQFLHDEGVEVTSPFADILNAVMDLGGFAYVIGVIASTATLASIMSTADSVLIAISQLITTEVITPIFKNIEGRKLANIGRLTSLVSMGAALLFAFYGGQGLSELIIVQYGLLMQAVPMYMAGLFAKYDFHPWFLCCAAIGGACTTLTLHFSLSNDSDEGHTIPINLGLAGVAANIVLILFFEAFRQLLQRLTKAFHWKRPTWDIPETEKFGEGTLTSTFIKSAMEGIREPGTDIWFMLLGICLSVVCTPITETATPPLDKVTGLLQFPPNVVGGIPSWAFRLIMAFIPTTMILLYSIYALPNELFPEDEVNTKSSTPAEEIESLSDAASLSVVQNETDIKDSTLEVVDLESSNS